MLLEVSCVIHSLPLNWDVGFLDYSDTAIVYVNYGMHLEKLSFTNVHTPVCIPVLCLQYSQLTYCTYSIIPVRTSIQYYAMAKLTPGQLV